MRRTSDGHTSAQEWSLKALGQSRGARGPLRPGPRGPWTETTVSPLGLSPKVTVLLVPGQQDLCLGDWLSAPPLPPTPKQSVRSWDRAGSPRLPGCVAPGTRTKALLA